MSIDFMAMLEEEFAAATGYEDEAHDRVSADEPLPAPLDAPGGGAMHSAARDARLKAPVVEGVRTRQPEIPVELRLPAGWRETCRVRGPIGDVWVVPDAISNAAAVELAACVDAEASAAKWVRLHGRDVQEWGRDEALPGYCETLVGALQAHEVWGANVRCNHVLINRYTAEGGIMPHTDGPAYVPATATLSLAQPAIFRFAPLRGRDERGGGHDTAPTMSVLLPPRTLVVFTGPAYTAHTHEILPGATARAPDDCVNTPAGTPCTRDGRRVSLTFRHMLELEGGAREGQA